MGLEHSLSNNVIYVIFAIQGALLSSLRETSSDLRLFHVFYGTRISIILDRTACKWSMIGGR